MKKRYIVMAPNNFQVMFFIIIIIIIIIIKEHKGISVLVSGLFLILFFDGLDSRELICLKHDKKPVPSIIFQVLRTLN
jgi:hypothetical protein